MAKDRISPVLTLLIFAATAIAFGYVFVRLPYYSDDLWFAQPLAGWLFRGEGDWSMHELLHSIGEHMVDDNARLANIIFSFALLLPKWLVGAISGTWVFATLYLVARVSGIGLKFPWLAVWLVVLWTFGLPWVNDLWQECYTFNYVWATGIAMTSVLVFMRKSSLGYGLAIGLGLLTGLWHEGFGVPVAVGMLATICIMPRRMYNGPRLAMSVAMIGGSIILLVTPGGLRRLDTSSVIPMLSTFVSVLKYHVPTIVFFFVLGITVCIRRARSRLDTPLMILLVTTALTAYGIHTKTNFNLHIGWMGLVASITGTIHCLLALDGCLRVGARMATVLRTSTVVAGILTGIHLVAVDIATDDWSRTLDRALAAYRTNPEREIFMSYPHEYDMPLPSLGRPYYNAFTRRWYLGHINRTYFPGREDLTFRPIPVELANVTAMSGEAMDGIPGLRRIGKYIFVPFESLTPGVTILRPYEKIGTVSFGAIKKERFITYIPFRSRADGRLYYYICPADTRFMRLFHGAITGINER